MSNNNINIYKDPVTTDKMLKQNSEKFWIERGEKMALNLFLEMSSRVPAYRDFLKKNKVNPATVKTIDDFKKLPTLDKDNYLRAYPRKDLVWDGDLKNQSWVISTTSGSTGKPYYFPRQNFQDEQYALTAELYLRSNFKIHEQSTLYIVAFPMGAWIGGVFTYEAVKEVSGRGYNLSIITPGINKTEVIKAIKNLGNDFDQIIIGSYAPFLKDIIDDGIRQGLNWKSYKLGFIFSAEGFSEVFRDYIQRRAGLKNIYIDTLNHYGTVDLGTMSHETPLSILIRRTALANSSFYVDLFAQTKKLPTFTQYIPEMFYFEDDNGRLYCSAYSGIPLVRYDLKDAGGLISKNEVEKLASSYGIDIHKKAKDAEINDTIWNLPFVYVYERADFSVSFYAFQIYPETIRRALQDLKLQEKITGKFTMLVRYDREGQQIFEVNVEMKANQTTDASLEKLIGDLIIENLLRDSSEYNEVYRDYGAKKVSPIVALWPYEDELYFRPGTKQRWVEKS